MKRLDSIIIVILISCLIFEPLIDKPVVHPFREFLSDNKFIRLGNFKVKLQVQIGSAGSPFHIKRAE